MIASLPPGTPLLLGALLLAIAPRRTVGVLGLVLPLVSLAHLLLAHADGDVVALSFLGEDLTPVRVDRLSLVWGYVFHLAAFLGALFAFHVRDRVQHVAAAAYTGASIGAAFAGDLLTLFCYWEATAIASVFLIWASRNASALRCGIRYLVIQVLSGVLLLAGAVLQLRDTGSLAFTAFGLETPAHVLIFLGFGVKAAFPFLHNWLQDAYPQATPTGTVILSAFTTKLAIYALARGFPGEDLLIPIGVAMTLFPIFFAVIENDLRRVLAYSLNNQLGFMVVGVGIGTELALNGTAAHAVAHIVYKSLLFMAMGAVLHRTGTIRASELGGLHRTMPFTTVFCIIGALSISAMPLFSGFTTKSMILGAVGEEHMVWVWLGLLFASAGVVDHSGIKVPFFAFFAHDSGRRPREAPWNMLAAMGLAAFLCIFIGVHPDPLYRLLPYQVEYRAYTAVHVVGQLELLLFAALAFVVLFRTRIYPPELVSTNLDTDWVYRRAAPRVVHALRRVIGGALDALGAGAARAVEAARLWLARTHGHAGFFARTWSTSGTVLWIALVLAAFLILNYLE